MIYKWERKNHNCNLTPRKEGTSQNVEHIICADSGAEVPKWERWVWSCLLVAEIPRYERCFLGLVGGSRDSLGLVGSIDAHRGSWGVTGAHSTEMPLSRFQTACSSIGIAHHQSIWQGRNSNSAVGRWVEKVRSQRFIWSSCREGRQRNTCLYPPKRSTSVL